jgi:hypothetical protein
MHCGRVPSFKTYSRNVTLKYNEAFDNRIRIISFKLKGVTAVGLFEKVPQKASLRKPFAQFLGYFSG